MLKERRLRHLRFAGIEAGLALEKLADVLLELAEIGIKQPRVVIVQALKRAA